MLFCSCLSIRHGRTGRSRAAALRTCILPFTSRAGCDTSRSRSSLYLRKNGLFTFVLYCIICLWTLFPLRTCISTGGFLNLRQKIDRFSFMLCSFCNLLMLFQIYREVIYMLTLQEVFLYVLANVIVYLINSQLETIHKRKSSKAS